MTTKHLFFALPVAAASLGLVACDVETVEEGDLTLPDVQKTQEGNIDLPEVDVRGGDMTLPRYDTQGGNLDLPEVDVKAPDVDVDTGTKTIEVPTLDVDVDTPRDGEASMDNRDRTIDNSSGAIEPRHTSPLPPAAPAPEE